MAQTEKSLDELWERLLLTSPTNDDLCRIIISIPDLAEKAWSELLVQRPTAEDLLRIMDYSRNSVFTKRSWRLFCQKAKAGLVNHSDLRHVMAFFAHKKEAVSFLMASNPNLDDLRVIEKYFPEMAKEVKRHRSKREEARQIILEMLRK